MQWIEIPREYFIKGGLIRKFYVKGDEEKNMIFCNKQIKETSYKVTIFEERRKK
jgi:hypothetical protein